MVYKKKSKKAEKVEEKGEELESKPQEQPELPQDVQDVFTMTENVKHNGRRYMVGEHVSGSVGRFMVQKGWAE